MMEGGGGGSWGKLDSSGGAVQMTTPVVFWGKCPSGGVEGSNSEQVVRAV